VVKPGEDIYGIAQYYRIDVYALVLANNMSPPFTVHPGERLRLPAGEAGEATANRDTGEAQPEAQTPSPPPRPKERSAPAAEQPVEAVANQAGFVWPVAGRIISDFGPKGQGLRNDGINIAAPAGTPVRATDGGVVTYAGNELRSFGNILLVRHSGGWVSAYAHNEALLVSQGAKVTKGQVIAKVGRTGDISEPQLHFQLRKGGKPVDPLNYLPRPAT
jgi:murein DD-endopeptidase MepM/ murein hydrolase activator NlpD